MVMNTQTRRRRHYNIFNASHFNKPQKLRLRNVTMRSHLNPRGQKYRHSSKNMLYLSNNNKTFKNIHELRPLPSRRQGQGPPLRFFSHANKTFKNNKTQGQLPSRNTPIQNISDKSYLPSHIYNDLKQRHRHRHRHRHFKESKKTSLNNILNHDVIKINKSKFTLKNRYVPGSGVGAISANVRHLKKRFA